MRLILLLTLALAGSASAQVNLHFKDGRILNASQLRRDKDTIIATVEIPAAAPAGVATKGDLGFPLSSLFKLEFPKPGVIDLAPELIANGKAEEALAKLEPVTRFYAGFRDAPGSWWPDLVPLQLQALLVLNRNREAADLADYFSRVVVEPEVAKLAKAFTAISMTSKGAHKASLALYEEAALATERTDLLGLLAVKKGESLLAVADALTEKGETEPAGLLYEEALLSFLRIPALYRTQRMFLPQALFGAAQAYFGLRDFERARQSLKEITTGFAATPQAKAAVDLGQKIEKFAALVAAPQSEQKK